jgi:hypothetical protein
MRGKREKRVAQVAQTLLVRKRVVRMLDAGCWMLDAGCWSRGYEGSGGVVREGVAVERKDTKDGRDRKDAVI